MNWDETKGRWTQVKGKVPALIAPTPKLGRQRAPVF